jgi:hypothetical protein
MPFTARLPRLSVDHWQQIDKALNKLVTCLAKRPCDVNRIEQDSAYIGQLAKTLTAFGTAARAALLADDIVDSRSWSTESRAERWA